MTDEEVRYADIAANHAVFTLNRTDEEVGYPDIAANHAVFTLT